MMLKKIKSTILYSGHLSISLYQIIKDKIFSKKPLTNYLILDIDNTVALTWPSLKQNFPSESNRLSQLPVLKPMQKWYLQWRSQNPGNTIFLSARSIKYYEVTRKWLYSNHLIRKNDYLILVPNVSYKKGIVNGLSTLLGNLEMVDDLSWNHENGEIKFYEEIISYFKKHPRINYKGYDYISSIISKKRD